MQRRDGLIYINNVNGQQIDGRMLGGLGNLYKHTHTHTHTQVEQTYLPYINIRAHPHVNIRLFLFPCKRSRIVFFYPSEDNCGGGDRHKKQYQTNMYKLI